MTDIGVSLPHIIDKKQSNYDIFLKKMPLMVHCMRGEEETARIRRTKESLRGVTLPIGLLALPFLAHAHAIRLGGFFKRLGVRRKRLSRRPDFGRFVWHGKDENLLE